MSVAQSDPQQLAQRLAAMREEHRDLDDVIHRLEESTAVDEVQVRRLKKRKLLLRDEIAWVERQMAPPSHA